MKLSDYKKDYYFYTGKVSDIVRQLSFAGIVIIWIFRSGDGMSTKVPDMLLFPLGFFVLALFFDLFHYIISSIIWGSFHRRQEKKLKNLSEDPDLMTPAWYNWPSIFLFTAKIVTVLIAYIIIIKFFLLILLKHPTI